MVGTPRPPEPPENRLIRKGACAKFSPMTKPSKSTLLLVIALLASLAAAANFYVGKTTEHAKRVQVEHQMASLKKDVAALEKERDELMQAKTSLETQTADLTKQAKAVADQLVQEKRAREALNTELAQVRKDATNIQTQIDQERGEKVAIAEDLAKAKQSYQALSNELTTLRQAKEALEKRVKEMLAARAKEAEQIVVTPSGAAPSAAVPSAAAPAAAGASKAAAAVPAGKGTDGKVLVVNREFDFIVVNLGSRDAIKKGNRFVVLRGDKQIMTVEADKIYDNMSAANMLEEEKKGSEVKEGDTVRLVS